jgi:hypothetical protein
LPLTANKATVTSKIDSLNYWNDGGTIASEGVAWGMRVLTPDYPFKEGKPASDKLRKILVLFGDGKNNVPMNIDNSPMLTDYTAYGYASGRMLAEGAFTGLSNDPGENAPILEAGTQAFVDQRMALACENAKAKDITILTILFKETDWSTAQAYKNCATDANSAIVASDSVAMADAFADVADQILKSYLRK